MAAEAPVRRRKVIRDLKADAEKKSVREARFIARTRGLYPLDAPGLPVPGPDFIDHAMDLGDTTQVETIKEKGTRKTTTRVVPGDILFELHRKALREPGFTMPVTTRPGKREVVTFIPGHIWGQHIQQWQTEALTAPLVDGPHPAKVMVIGKMPGREEANELRNLVGPSGEILVTMIDQLRIKGSADWYVTNLIKFRPPDGGQNLKANWLNDCKHLLHQELRLVKPDYILCLGADASKALLGPKFTVSYMEGRVEEFTFDVGFDPEEPQLHTSLVMTVLHPAQVAREQSQARILERGLARWNLLLKGVRFDKEERGLDHRTITTLEELEELLDEIDRDPEKTDKVIACDAEWHGQHPVNAGSYLRLFQFAWKPKHAACVRLRAAGGKIAFFDENGKPAIKRAFRLLQKWFADKRVVGHYFNADLEWLVATGLDLRGSYAVPRYDTEDGTPAWVRTRTEGGADTALMAHAIEETASFGLEALAMRYTTAPRYDIPMQEWCTAQREQYKVLEGYGEAPDSLIIPYSVYDADATLRLFYELDDLLDRDYEGNCCREAFWETSIAAPAVLEIHRNGIVVDRERVDELTTAFLEARNKAQEKIRTWAKWPTFNIRSAYAVREFLYGAKLNRMLTKDGQEYVRIRPPGARTLRVTPILDTSKRPKLWSEIVEKGKEADHTPGTNKTILSLLAQDNLEVFEQINWIRDFRFLDQVLKSVLRPPVSDKEGVWLRDDDNGLVYDAGLAACVCDDGRVRTHVYQTKETGRWSSARPPLQNISKQRDADYERLLGKKYEHKLRSILTVSPGHVLIEADYIGAELYGMAIMAGDANMINHALRNQLPEEHPDYYDIHSNVACLAFGLQCEPTKKGLKAINKAHFRILAKNVIFGIAYGRGAKAIALAAREQGIHVTVEDAQKVIDTIFAMYPGLVPFFDECRRRAREERWLCHCFGRFRRFPFASDFALEGEFERQAMNFPIQGMIASAVNRAMSHIYHYREEVGEPDMYRILLQIHDAILLEVPYANVAHVVDKVLPYAMVQRVPIYPTTLDGIPTGRGPYYLGIDTEVAEHWGEKISQARCLELGIPTRFGKAA